MLLNLAFFPKIFSLKHCLLQEFFFFTQKLFCSPKNSQRNFFLFQKLKLFNNFHWLSQGTGANVKRVSVYHKRNFFLFLPPKKYFHRKLFSATQFLFFCSQMKCSQKTFSHKKIYNILTIKLETEITFFYQILCLPATFSKKKLV